MQFFSISAFSVEIWIKEYFSIFLPLFNSIQFVFLFMFLILYTLPIYHSLVILETFLKYLICLCFPSIGNERSSISSWYNDRFLRLVPVAFHSIKLSCYFPLADTFQPLNVNSFETARNMCRNMFYPREKESRTGMKRFPWAVRHIHKYLASTAARQKPPREIIT